MKDLMEQQLAECNKCAAAGHRDVCDACIQNRTLVSELKDRVREVLNLRRSLGLEEDVIRDRRITDAGGDPAWTNADGKLIPVRDMTDRHLMNAIMYLQRRHQSLVFGMAVFADKGGTDDDGATESMELHGPELTCNPVYTRLLEEALVRGLVSPEGLSRKPAGVRSPGVRRTSYQYDVKAVIELSGEELHAIIRLAESHYDHKCKALAAKGGLLFGMWNEIGLPQSSVRAAAKIQRAVSIPDLNLLCKVLEDAGLPGAPEITRAIWFPIRAILKEALGERERLNTQRQPPAWDPSASTP